MVAEPELRAGITRTGAESGAIDLDLQVNPQLLVLG